MKIIQVLPGGWCLLSSKKLLGKCRWMGSHFHNWTDYNGVPFLVELLEWSRTFSGFRDKKVLVSRDLKIARFAVKKWFPAVVLIFNSRLAD